MMELWLSCTSWSWSSVAAATPSDKAAKIRLTTFKIFRESQLLQTLRFGKPSQFPFYIYKETCRSSHNETFVGGYFDVLTTTSLLLALRVRMHEWRPWRNDPRSRLPLSFSFHRSRSVEVVKCTLAVSSPPTPSDIYEDIERAEVKSKSVGMNVISM